MSGLLDHINEMQAAEAFSRQAPLFDELYGKNTTIQYKRDRVRNHILQYLQTGNSLLELNCGSGEDALFFARKGYSVHATDISEGMLQVMVKKILDSEMTGHLSTEICSFTALEFLKNKGPFDYVYSNFGGLNCTGELDKVLKSLSPLVKPGGYVTLVIISRFCLWETFMMFRGAFRTAFRRFFSKNGRKAQVEGCYFKCWYYSPAYVKRKMPENFNLLGVEGLCSLVPPSYFEHFPENRPRLFSFLRKAEDRWKDRWPWSLIGDYYIISFRKMP